MPKASRPISGGAMIKTGLAGVAAWAGLLLSCATSWAQTGYPMLMSLKPVAIQQGTSVECQVEARYSLSGAHQVFVSGTGVTGEVVPVEEPPVKPGETAKPLLKRMVKFTVASDAQPGPREFRVATPQGASTVGQLVIVRDPVIYEQAENNSLDKAQEATLPATLCGVVEKSEDSDFWKFHVTAGQSVLFHVRSQRLEDKIHDLQVHSDPILFLRDLQGSVIATSDNAFFADPSLAYTFPQEGDYLLEIRDVRYQGNVYWEYAIEAHSRPFVTQVHPFVVAPERETTVTLAGVHLPTAGNASLLAPALRKGRQETPVVINGEPGNPVAVHVTDLPLLVEPDGANDTLEQAVAITVPMVVQGTISQSSDLDVYAFEAKKGDLLTFEVLGRRYDSALDSYLRLLNDKGQVLREDDDMRDGRLQWSDTLIDGWSVPADGKYFVEVRDVHLRGGAGYAYGLQVTASHPSFELSVDTDKTNLSPGGFGVIFVRATRKHGFTGEITLQIEGLPEGVTATCGRILAGKGQDGAIILAASPEAKPVMSRIRITGTGMHAPAADQPPQQLVAEMRPFQEIYLPGGGRGHFEVGDHVICVGAPGDIRSIKLSETDLRLKPGESKKIVVTIERAPGLTANISLDPLFQHLSQVFANTLPEGVTIDGGQSKTLLSGGASEGHITLKADAKAPAVEKQLCCIMANLSLNFVMKSTVSSPPLLISVEPATP